MRLLSAVTALFLSASSLAASEQVERLLHAMHMSEFLDILNEEGQTQGQSINQSMLDGAGGSYFEAQIKELYDPVWMYEQMSNAVDWNMTEAQLEQAAIFFESELGQIIVSLENSARRALSDEAIEDMARSVYEQTDRENAFFGLVDEYVQVNNLIEQNVRGTINADISFYRGLVTGQGALVNEEAWLAELLSQREETEKETTEWMYSFLLLAYQPLSEAQMRENIAFSRTETGRSLNNALFEGFDQMINGISFQLGEAVAQAMQASDL